MLYILFTKFFSLTFIIFISLIFVLLSLFYLIVSKVNSEFKNFVNATLPFS